MEFVVIENHCIKNVEKREANSKKRANWPDARGVCLNGNTLFYVSVVLAVCWNFVGTFFARPFVRIERYILKMFAETMPTMER